jgi:hypothetical protein
MAAIDKQLIAARDVASQLMKRKNFAAREPGVIVVFCIVFIGKSPPLTHAPVYINSANSYIYSRCWSARSPHPQVDPEEKSCHQVSDLDDML